MTPVAKRQGGHKFGREQLLHLSVCIVPTGEERDELPRGVSAVHVPREKTAVLDADVTAQALQLSLVIRTGVAIVSFERM
jgi:hypothetical protein